MTSLSVAPHRVEPQAPGVGLRETQALVPADVSFTSAAAERRCGYLFIARSCCHPFIDQSVRGRSDASCVLMWKCVGGRVVNLDHYFDCDVDLVGGGALY